MVIDKFNPEPRYPHIYAIYYKRYYQNIGLDEEWTFTEELLQCPEGEFYIREFAENYTDWKWYNQKLTKITRREARNWLTAALRREQCDHVKRGAERRFAGTSAPSDVTHG